jgi:hypothetical protein
VSRRSGGLRSEKAQGFERRFEGPEILGELLQVCRSQMSLEDIIRAMHEGLAAKRSPGEVFPTFFDGEPHFPNPALARQLFQNLFGLWDLLQAGKTWRAAPPLRPKKSKRAPASPPAPFGQAGPDPTYVAEALEYLKGLNTRESLRLADAFENRQDALLTWLDESSLTNDGYQAARNLLFEFFALLTLGWPAGLRSLTLRELNSGAPWPQGLPESLEVYAHKALSQSGNAVEQIREAVWRGLLALWNARRMTAVGNT